MNRPEVIYRPSPEATPASELSTVVDAYRFLIKSELIDSEKKGGPATAPVDARKDKDAGTNSHCT